MAVTEIPCQLGSAIPSELDIPVEDAPPPPEPQEVNPARDDFVSTPAETRLFIVVRGQVTPTNPAPGPARVCRVDLSEPETQALIERANASLASVRETMGGENPSAEMAMVYLYDAHEAIESLGSFSGCGSHPVVDRLRQRYFEALELVPAEQRDPTGDGLMEELNNFVIPHADGSETVIFAEPGSRVEVEAGTLSSPPAA